ncbi:MAG: hypothetical protein AB7I48_18025 [Planctomycetaceae bacterium]
MSQSITLTLPDEVDRALQDEAVRSGRSPEQVALEWIQSNVARPPRGSAEALLLSHGAWSMTPDEQARIERIIEEEQPQNTDHSAGFPYEFRGDE